MTWKNNTNDLRVRILWSAVRGNNRNHAQLYRGVGFTVMCFLMHVVESNAYSWFLIVCNHTVSTACGHDIHFPPLLTTSRNQRRKQAKSWPPSTTTIITHPLIHISRLIRGGSLEAQLQSSGAKNQLLGCLCTRVVIVRPLASLSGPHVVV
jgi:hypothetical protein